jgi:hypothetical protein
LRDGAAELVKRGQLTRDEAPDPNPETEAKMRVRTDISEQAGYDDIEAGYFSVNAKSPDALAQAIRDAQGVVFGVQGDDAGWSNLLNPKPAVSAEWGHALYGMGFHMHDGQKCIIAKSSWCKTGVKEHHIKQNYFDSGNTFDGWTLIPKENLPMVRRFKVDDHGKLGVMLITDGAFDAPIFWAKHEAMYARLLADYEVPVDAPVIPIP